MTRVVMTFDLPDVDAVEGVKELASMALEHLGGVRVVDVQVFGARQMGLAGAAPPKAAAARSVKRPDAVGQAPVQPRPRADVTIDCCLSCAHFQMAQNRDGSGRVKWGVCKVTGRDLDEVNKRCGAWVREGRENV